MRTDVLACQNRSIPGITKLIVQGVLQPKPLCDSVQLKRIRFVPAVQLPSGIQVRHDQEGGYMHHKFAIVDGRTLITGSLNWTTQAIQNNRENVLVLEDAEYVKPFLEEFERIWEEYNPSNYTFFSKDDK